LKTLGVVAGRLSEHSTRLFRKSVNIKARDLSSVGKLATENSCH